MDRNQIAYFLDIAASGNMSHSAQRLCIAQPSLSRAIKQLERELGARLFKRTAKGMELTVQGKMLQQRLAPVAAELASIETMFKDDADEPREIRVQVAAASEVASRAIAGWIKANPDCRLVLAQGAQGSAEQSDIVIAADAVDGSLASERFSERIMLASADASGFGEFPVSLAALGGYDFIALPRAYGFASAVATMCAAESFAPHVVFTSNNPMVVREMIGLGLGVGFWPEKSWGDASDAGIKLLELANGATRDVHISLTQHGSANAAAHACYDYLRHQFSVVFK